MKYGDGALNGKAGLRVHFDDFCSFANGPGNLSDLKTEALEMFQQKRELGLIKGLAGNKNQIHFLEEDIDYIVLISNHDPQKSNFISGLKYLEQNFSKSPKGIEIKVCGSNFIGYRLYKEKVVKLKDFLAHHSLSQNSL